MGCGIYSGIKHAKKKHVRSLEAYGKIMISDDMTTEEIMCELDEEYGDNFNWHMVSLTNQTFVNELKKELTNDDPFLVDAVFTVAKCESNDDVLFVGSIDGKERWRIYHLTYSMSNTKGYPRYIEFDTRKAAVGYIQEQFKQDYL